MASLPELPGHLLTVAEYASIGEDDRFRWELQEGNLVMSPSSTPRHMIANPMSSRSTSTSCGDGNPEISMSPS